MIYIFRIIVAQKDYNFFQTSKFRGKADSVCVSAINHDLRGYLIRHSLAYISKIELKIDSWGYKSRELCLHSTLVRSIK